MGIYLPNMEMPKGCFECPFSHYQFDGEESVLVCFVLCEIVSDDGEMAKNCPLVTVPTPHGDLIDQKELMKRFCGHCDGYEECSDKSMRNRAEECFDLKLIANTPTVIKAEEGET